MSNNVATRIALIGDSMVDVYEWGNIKKLSSECIMPVFVPNEGCSTERRMGGLANVVQNLRVLMPSAELYVWTARGDDEEGEWLANAYANIHAHTTWSRATHTTRKTRYATSQSIVFRADRDGRIEERMDSIDKFTALNLDLIIISDYAKGMCATDWIVPLIAWARDHQIPVYVDPKPENGSYDKYRGCTLLKLNANEFAMATWDLPAWNQIYVTRAENGMDIWRNDTATWTTIPTHNVSPADVTGAGDIVLAMLAAGYFSERNERNERKRAQMALWMATRSVQHVGTYCIQPADLVAMYFEWRTTKCVTIQELAALKVSLIVTNGCFDMLHPGHLDLLHHCRELTTTSSPSSYVVVALNSDDSVRRLKSGHTPPRPIQPLAERIQQVAALKDVDFVVSFDENTPVELLRVLRPTILVKGGDYTLDQIAGREYVGRVEILPFKRDMSTTKRIQGLKRMEE